MRRCTIEGAAYLLLVGRSDIGSFTSAYPILGTFMGTYSTLRKTYRLPPPLASQSKNPLSAYVANPLSFSPERSLHNFVADNFGRFRPKLAHFVTRDKNPDASPKVSAFLDHNEQSPSSSSSYSSSLERQSNASDPKAKSFSLEKSPATSPRISSAFEYIHLDPSASETQIKISINFFSIWFL
ncbi:hypothetical protein GBA52_009102 [Prunus armeniaca]|nr:hypothetical protein GBA52_009102 [Prunus armeniaca]